MWGVYWPPRYFGDRYWGNGGAGPAPPPSVIYSGDGWGSADDYRRHARARDEQFRAARDRRDRERAQLAIDLRAALEKTHKPAPQARAVIAEAILREPDMAALAIDLQRAMLMLAGRQTMARRAIMAAQAQAAAFAEAERALAAMMADEDDDEEAIMMILAQVV